MRHHAEIDNHSFLHFAVRTCTRKIPVLAESMVFDVDYGGSGPANECNHHGTEAHSLVILLPHFAFLLCFLNLLPQFDGIKWSPSKIQI